MPITYNKKLIPRASELRNNMTRQERHLWYDFLSAYPVRFQRQKVIGSFIADFYCHKARLVIELDGSQHYSDEGLYNDSERTVKLNSLGLRVIRLSNIDIDKNFRGVCGFIDETVQGALIYPIL